MLDAQTHWRRCPTPQQADGTSQAPQQAHKQAQAPHQAPKQAQARHRRLKNGQPQAKLARMAGQRRWTQATDD